MNADRSVAGGLFTGLHAELTGAVLRVFFEVYNELGAGFLESVYHAALRIALTQHGFRVESEVPIQVWFRGEAVGRFVADMVINGEVLLELKAAHTLDKSYEAQTLHYLKATTLEVALLLNFGPKPEFRRYIVSNAEKKIRVHPR